MIGKLRFVILALQGAWLVSNQIRLLQIFSGHSIHIMIKNSKKDSNKTKIQNFNWRLMRRLKIKLPKLSLNLR